MNATGRSEVHVIILILGAVELGAEEERLSSISVDNHATLKYDASEPPQLRIRHFGMPDQRPKHDVTVLEIILEGREWLPCHLDAVPFLPTN